ncbi:uncharacterized protein [Primulina eburnea]|uniref:uncharacterized protein n=1 Tax=Primulina eburnea TaxID=1245227 RepID=UPI003C6CC28E
MFSKENYDDWKIRIQAHLAAQDDDMWYIITDGPMKILKVNTATATIEGAPQMVEKHIYEWTAEDKKKTNLDNVAKDILYKTLDKNLFAKIKTCTTAKETWEKLTQLCEGNDQTQENKLTVTIQKFDNAKMKPGETLTEFDERFSGIIIELISLGKDYSNREISLKVMRALPREWDVKTIAMQETKDLNKLELHDLFANLKAYEFELGIRIEEEPSTSQQTKALVASTVNLPVEESTSNKSAEKLSNEAMPRRDEKKSSDIRRVKDNKRFIKKKSQRVLVAEEEKGKWAESETEKSTSEESSSESEDEKLECLMAKEDQESIDEMATKKNELEESIWFLDSGCSRHMTRNKDLLSEIVNYKDQTITFGDNSKCRTVGKGKIIHDKVIIKDVLLVENLCYNLISINQLCDKGYTVEFKKLLCTVKTSSRNIMLTGHREQNTYKVKWNDDYLNENKFALHSKAEEETHQQDVWNSSYGFIWTNIRNELRGKEIYSRSN